jgi:hypothetical protein
MTYTTELERKKNIIVSFTKYVEKDYCGTASAVLRSTYKQMYEILKDLPVEKRMYAIDNYTYEVKAPTSVPDGLRQEDFVANILGQLMTTIFTLTHMDLKEDLLDAMYAIASLS